MGGIAISLARDNNRGMKTLPITTLPALREALKLDRKAWPRISETTGVPENTLRKLAYGDRKNPQLNTIQPLYDYFKRRAASVTKEAHGIEA